MPQHVPPPLVPRSTLRPTPTARTRSASNGPSPDSPSPLTHRQSARRPSVPSRLARWYVVPSAMDWSALVLTLELDLVVCILLLVVGLPIAYWIAFSRWRGKF